MRHALVLASFGASALAQGYGWGGAYSNTSCVSVVTETVYNYTTVCPCSTTSLTVLPTGGSSGVVTTTPGNGGNTVNPTGATTLTSSTVPNPSSTTTSLANPSSTTATSGATSSTTGVGSTTLANPPSTSFTSTNVGTPTLTSFSSLPNPTSTIATTSVTNDPSPVVPGAGTTSTIALASLPSDYQYRALYAHNLHRNNASIPILAWSDELAGYALQLAQTCVYGHSNAQGDGQYGQNIGAGFTPDQIPVMITNNMYNMEINNYPGPYGSNTINSSPPFSSWGHYSQIVWTSTTLVGCATFDCSNTAGGLQNTGSGILPFFTVCDYRVPGNVQGGWSQVATPGGGGTVVFV